jgi:hypothetical protein
MNEYLKNFEYAKDQLIYLRSKVETDNTLGLYDINKLSESLFANILNDTFDELILKNANTILHSNYPAIDLIDDSNKKVFQVTSTRSTDKVRSTIKKWQKGDYKNYQLNFFYLKEKPKFRTYTQKEFANSGVQASNFYDITDVLNIVEANPKKCQQLFNTFKTHLDTLSFEFNIQNYFNSFEPHLNDITSKAFNPYINKFLDFIRSRNKVLEIYSAGGQGKSHLLHELLNKETEYIPLIFKKNVNVSEDLKKLPSKKKFLFVFDDIDRFLDTSIFTELLSYSIGNENIKILISYRKASKSLINQFYRKYNHLPLEEIEIIWDDDSIAELIKTIAPKIEENKVQKIQHLFNNNPYLISKALSGDIKSIKDFSLKIVDDSKRALSDFNLSTDSINELLFKLSFSVPLHEENINRLNIENVKVILERLESANILRKLGRRYRFNPDIIGDLFLAYFIDEYGKRFEDILEKYLGLFSYTVFTNISYALTYLDDQTTLNQYLNNVINHWLIETNYSSDHLRLINKIVSFVPERSFMYLAECTKHLQPKENQHLMDESIFAGLATNISLSPDFNQDYKAINLGSIEPIISQLIYMLKNNYDCGAITIKDILDYLTSEEVINLPEPSYENHKLTYILKKIFSPLRTTNYEIIFEAIEFSKRWIQQPYNEQKIKIFQKSVLENLLNVTFDDSRSDGITYTWGKQILNINHPVIQKIINQVKEIVLEMFESDNEQLLYNALEVIRIGAYDFNMLHPEGKKFYSEIKKEFLTKVLKLVKSNVKIENFILSKIDDIALNILRIDEEKEEALEILKSIQRTDEYIFYQLVDNADYIIIDYDKFYQEYKDQKDILNWIHKSQTDRKHYNRFTAEQLKVISRLSATYISDEIVELLNSLNTDNWSTFSKLSYLLEYWFGTNSIELIKVYNESLQSIEADITKNILKELLLNKQILKLKEDDITTDISIDDLKIYSSVIFKNFDGTKIQLLNKLFHVVKSMNDDDLYMFINIIASDIYFQLKENEKFIDLFQPFIYQLIEIQFNKSFHFNSYLIYSLQIMKKQNKLDTELISLLQQIINDESYKIEDHDLKTIYKLLEINLETLLKIIYKKLISKKEDGYYRYFFHLYHDYDGLMEVGLLKSYVKSYDDFLIVVEKVYKFYNDFVEYPDELRTREIRIDLEWFFKYIVTEEYLNRFFSELYDSNNIEKIKVFYKIIPVSIEYIDLIIKNMNLMDNVVGSEALLNYLDRMGKIKDRSRSHMQNSPELLKEEQIFNKLHDHIESFSLKVKIKDKLKYIKLEKRREIEFDIERLMDK